MPIGHYYKILVFVEASQQCEVSYVIMKMKILYIIHDNKKGGAALSFLNMIKGVSKEHEVYVLTPHKNGYIPDELDKLGIWHKSAHYFWWEIAKVGNPCLDAVRFLLYKVLNVYNHLEARRLARLVKKMEINIIHSNSSTINIGALVSDITGQPHVWHLRELGEQDFSLKPVLRGDSIRKELNRGNSVYIAISEYVARFYASNIDNSVIVGLDNANSANALEHKAADGESKDETLNTKQIHLIYNGIDSSYDYKKPAERYHAGAPAFLISGNYCEEKGQIDVARAVGVLVSQGVTHFKVYRAGRGDFAEVHEYLSRERLENYVLFCGLVDDMLALRKNCDVEIVASRAEAFGRVTVEAMRASNPVIGSATGGTTELIEDGVNGFLYECKNIESLAECMKRFIDDPSLACRMGQNAYEWSVNRFTSESNIKNVLAIYETI